MRMQPGSPILANHLGAAAASTVRQPATGTGVATGVPGEFDGILQALAVSGTQSGAQPVSPVAANLSSIGRVPAIPALRGTGTPDQPGLIEAAAGLATGTTPATPAPTAPTTKSMLLVSDTGPQTAPTDDCI